jgi:hypothetical protein
MNWGGWGWGDENGKERGDVEGGVGRGSDLMIATM